MPDWDYDKTWYHGSPLRLTILCKGSTITQDRDLARVFSHRPAIVSISDDGRIEHDGKVPGFLYRIAEEVQPADAYPHPRSSVDPQAEWLTNRELRLALVGPTQIVKEELLSEEEVAELRRRARTRS